MIFKKHMVRFLDVLFDNYPRQVGFPHRLKIAGKINKQNKNNILLLADKYHKNSPVFTSLYETHINKLWVDFDSKGDEQLAFNDAKTFYFRLLEKSIKDEHIFLVYTGNKGFHIYILHEHLDITDAIREDLHLVLSYLTEGLQHIDSPLFSDINRLVRIAGIQRPNHLFVVCISPGMLFNNYNSIYDFFQEHQFNYTKIFDICTSFLRERKLNGFAVNGTDQGKNYIAMVKEIVEQEDWVKSTNYKKYNIVQEIATNIEYAYKTNKEGFAKAVDLVLKATLTKEQYYGIIIANPLHKVRVSATIRLLKQDFTPKDIADFYSTLDWIDFSYEKTLWYIEDLRKRYIK